MAQLIPKGLFGAPLLALVACCVCILIVHGPAHGRTEVPLRACWLQPRSPCCSRAALRAPGMSIIFHHHARLAALVHAGSRLVALCMRAALTHTAALAAAR